MVPEIDVPGHATAILAAHPEYGVGGVEAVRARVREPWTRFGISDEVLNVEEATVRFVCDVFDEVCDVFDSDVVGFGGDEARSGAGATTRARRSSWPSAGSPTRRSCRRGSSAASPRTSPAADDG